VPATLPAGITIKNFESLRSSQLAGLDLAARLLLEVEPDTVRKATLYMIASAFFELMLMGFLVYMRG
jgi:hypothetical protein